MPRYRFRWEYVPADTLKEIVTKLDLTGDPLPSLRRVFGARPNANFVRELWPVLREGWLSRDAEMRAWLVEALRASRLGDLSLTDEMDYLRSCRNAGRLRTLVLIGFHSLGEEGDEVPAPPPTPDLEEPTRSSDSRRTDPVFDLDAAVDAAWATFVGLLDELLAALDEGDSVLLGLPTAISPGDLTGAAPYVHLEALDAGRLQAEVSSNAFLDPRLRLSEVAERELAALGWHALSTPPLRQEEIRKLAKQD